MDAKEIDIAGALQLFESQGAVFLDVRDPDSYGAARIPGAVHLSDANVAAFTAETAKEKVLVVYCYHGNASQGGAVHFTEQGFEAMSLIGGFNAWSAAGHPSESPGDSADTPQVSASEEAVAQLQGFMKSEAAETCVRLTLEGQRFGLALDEARPGDVRFEHAGLPFVVEPELAKPVNGLRVGWSSQAGGFTIDGGTVPVTPGMLGRDEMRQGIEALVGANKVVAFLKGTADSPMCGFSARTADILKSLGRPFADQNALVHPDYRYVLSEFSDWPTLPQVFVGGKLVGGSDILTQMHQSGELAKVVAAAFDEA